jgi:hypothetical protein
MTRTRTLLAALAVSSLVALPAFAAPINDGGPHTKCAPRQTRVLQTKTCPARKNRPAFTVARACCTKDGKTRCKAFPHCPSNSPS